MKLRFLALFGAVLCLSGLASGEEILDGAVYRIVNSYYSGRSMATSANEQWAVGLPTVANDEGQLWLTVKSGDYFYLRNVATGRYLSSPNATSQQWSLQLVTAPQDATMLMKITDYNGHKTIHVSKDSFGYGYAHCDAYNNVVGWVQDGAATQWDFFNQNYTDEQIAAIKEHWAREADMLAQVGTYNSLLTELFEDAACTKPKAGVTPSQTEAYGQLPEVLQRIVDKIYASEWEETTTYKGTSATWDADYAERYRVQLYEPYSEGGAAAGMAGIAAYTNMNNPTGILGDKGTMMCVFVDDDIPTGASLYINAYADTDLHTGTTDGIRLQKGLNLFICHEDNAHYYVYYNVNTVQNGTHTQYKLSDFDPIKIHIEGGRINGLFNYAGDKLYGNDTREQLEYTMARATHPMYDLVGRFVILHFHLNDTTTKPNGAGEPARGLRSSLDLKNITGDQRTDPVDIMQAWDGMCMSERVLMGINSTEDIADPYNRGYYESIVGDGHEIAGYKTDPGFHYSDYFNNKMMGITMQGDLYMNATSWRTAYNVGNIGYVLTGFYGDGLWGPAHEYGHMNQGPINMAGTTETSNNIFSNVATFYSDRATTSRSEFLSTQLSDFMEGRSFLKYTGSFGTTRMFWQLWCYYHAAGHNKKFYPRLFELLRKNPLRKTQDFQGTHNPRYDQLHFAKMCCVAAEEDLTNFFTAWGFFVPFEYHIDDYAQYDAKLTQEDIDAVKQEIKDFHFPVNNAIITIDDRVNSPLPSEGGFDKTKAGELGGLDSFRQGQVPSGDFNYTVDGNTVTVETEGEDGVGFLIFDSEGNLKGFSNNHTFNVSDEMAEQLRNGELTLEAVGADEDQTSVKATNVMLDGSDEQKRALLAQSVESCDNVLNFADPTLTRVGFYIDKECDTLRDLIAQANGLLANADADGDEISDMIRLLTDEYNRLRNNPEVMVPIESGATYLFTNYAYSDHTLGCNATIATAPSYSRVASTGVPFNYQWIIEKEDEDSDSEIYTIRNLDTRLYITPTYRQSVSFNMNEVVTPYTLCRMTDNNKVGVFSFAPQGRTPFGIHVDGGRNIVQWDTSSNPTQWYLTKINGEDYVEALDLLTALIEDSRELLEQAGTTVDSPAEAVALNESLFDSNAKYTGGPNSDTFTSWNVLLDDDPNTYFHSDYSNKNTPDLLDHYIQITAPGDDTFRFVTLSYLTRGQDTQSTRISEFTVTASTDKQTWSTVYHVNSGLSTAPSTWNTTPEIAVPKGTRAVRFMVNRSGGTAGGHAFFAIAGLKLDNRSGEVICVPFQQYKKVTPTDMSNVAYSAADASTAVANPASDATALQSQLSTLKSHYDNLIAKMDVATGIDSLEPEEGENEEVIYYNLQGIRIPHPEKGIYIKRQGRKTEKIEL